MKKLSKNKTTNITIYQLPMLSQVIYLCTAICFTIAPLFTLIVLAGNDGNLFLLFENIVVTQKQGMWLQLGVMLVIDAVMFFVVFNTYLQLNVKRNQFIIRDFPGFKKVTINLDQVQSIKLTILNPLTPIRFKTYVVDIVHSEGTYRVISWTKNKLMFTTPYMQMTRLTKFCDRCNQYLNNR